MKPDDIAKIITEDIRVNNGISLNEEVIEEFWKKAAMAAGLAGAMLGSSANLKAAENQNQNIVQNSNEPIISDIKDKEDGKYGAVFLPQRQINGANQQVLDAYKKSDREKAIKLFAQKHKLQTNDFILVKTQVKDNKTCFIFKLLDQKAQDARNQARQEMLDNSRNSR